VSQHALTSQATTPRVGVVIPCYQSAPFLRDAVLAVLNQTVPPAQVVIVDDGSTDDPQSTVGDLLLGHSSLELFRQPNQGVGAARQLGATRLTEPNYLLFLDADDVPERNMLQRLIETLERTPNASVAWCLPSFIDARGQRLVAQPLAPRLRARGAFRTEPVPAFDAQTTFASIFALAGVLPSLCLMRAEAFRAARGWDVEFGQGYEDTDLLLRLSLHGDVLHVPQPLLRRRTHPGQSTSEAADHYWRQEQRLRAKWRDLSGLDERQLHIVLAGWRLYERQLAIQQGTKLALDRYRHGLYWSGTSAFLGGIRRYLRSCLLHHPILRRA
jgi:GT2 family glycosyltransferase